MIGYIVDLLQERNTIPEEEFEPHLFIGMVVVGEWGEYIECEFINLQSDTFFQRGLFPRSALRLIMSFDEDGNRMCWNGCIAKL